MLKRLLAVSTAMFLTLATFAFAAELRQDHPSTYVVRKGDTLWDIAGRFLKKPWEWPEIWQANPQVKNPHWIYPGDVLSLVYLNGRPMLSNSGPQVHSEAEIETIPLADIQFFLKQLSVVPEVKTLPYVVGVEDDRLLSSSGQVVYVRGLSGAQPGQMYSIVRTTQAYTRTHLVGNHEKTRHADLDYRGALLHKDWEAIWKDTISGRGPQPTFLGYEVAQHAVGEVTQVQGEVTTLLLRDEGAEVKVGDRVLPVEPRPYDAQYLPHPPTNIPPYAKVMAFADDVVSNGTRSVVALSVGSYDGVDNGTVFSIWHDGAIRPDIVKYSEPMQARGDKLAMPDAYVGHVMVFRTFDKVSYGLIMDGIRPTHVGDLLKHPDTTQ